MLFNLTTFFVELVIDWYYINVLKKPDPIRLKHRVLMITGIMLILIIFNDYRGQQIVKGLCVAVLPYCFFDNLLSWMRGKRGLDYKGQTKDWDKWYTKFHPKWVIVFRSLAAAVLIGLIYFL